MAFVRQGLCPPPVSGSNHLANPYIGNGGEIILSSDGEIPKCIEGNGEAK